jgi:hypothetical protein
MDPFEMVSNIVNGWRPASARGLKVIRVRLTPAQIEKMVEGRTLEFKAGVGAGPERCRSWCW